LRLGGSLGRRGRTRGTWSSWSARWTRWRRWTGSWTRPAAWTWRTRTSSWTPSVRWSTSPSSWCGAAWSSSPSWWPAWCSWSSCRVRRWATASDRAGRPPPARTTRAAPCHRSARRGGSLAAPRFESPGQRSIPDRRGRGAGDRRRGGPCRRGRGGPGHGRAAHRPGAAGQHQRQNQYRDATTFPRHGHPIPPPHTTHTPMRSTGRSPVRRSVVDKRWRINLYKAEDS
jgi:hypothetical protein